MTEQSMVKQERAARTREALIRSAAEVFDREGFSVASLAAISSRAGVSSGALHFHFASKTALADAVEAEALARLTAVTDGSLRLGTGRVQLLVDVTHGLARALRGDVVLRAGFQLSGEVSRPAQADLRGRWRRWVEVAVGRAEAEGELRPGVAAQDAVTAVVAATVGFEVLGARDAQWLSTAAVTRLWRLLLPTLVPPLLMADIEAEGTRSRTP
ncbi:ScbR family autoregulator-binding transcription factor [Streptomyces sp. H34-S4]|uniref:ScbR family autoregulator-binding transcription factor n=1 Tax=Streptomyces sp. H34-S4 TaxID=2996463 RepID=UPI00226EA329|nr:ScbR family autoregulator-binding transcription factor [Streptomyces sp. H34-S4]MCY0935089.1 ScbR family autoregulator-binding transcription factor [Streptomyces sp. H34-S4]